MLLAMKRHSCDPMVSRGPGDQKSSKLVARQPDIQDQQQRACSSPCFHDGSVSGTNSSANTVLAVSGNQRGLYAAQSGGVISNIRDIACVGAGLGSTHQPQHSRCGVVAEATLSEQHCDTDAIGDRYFILNSQFCRRKISSNSLNHYSPVHIHETTTSSRFATRALSSRIPQVSTAISQFVGKVGVNRSTVSNAGEAVLSLGTAAAKSSVGIGERAERLVGDCCSSYTEQHCKYPEVSKMTKLNKQETKPGTSCSGPNTSSLHVSAAASTASALPDEYDAEQRPPFVVVKQAAATAVGSITNTSPSPSSVSSCATTTSSVTTTAELAQASTTLSSNIKQVEASLDVLRTRISLDSAVVGSCVCESASVLSESNVGRPFKASAGCAASCDFSDIAISHQQGLRPLMSQEPLTVGLPPGSVVCAKPSQTTEVEACTGGRNVELRSHIAKPSPKYSPMTISSTALLSAPSGQFSRSATTTQVSEQDCGVADGMGSSIMNASADRTSSFSTLQQALDASVLRSRGLSALQCVPPVNCLEKLVFVVECSQETGRRCGSFADGGDALVLDLIRSAVRRITACRLAISGAVRPLLVEWAADAPRWRRLDNDGNADFSNINDDEYGGIAAVGGWRARRPSSAATASAGPLAALQAALDDLRPAQHASEPPCDLHALLDSIKHATGLDELSHWGESGPPFVVRAILFYSRPEPPSSLPLVLSPSASPSFPLTQGIAELTTASVSGEGRSGLLHPLVYHPLFVFDIVYIIPDDRCDLPLAPTLPHFSAESSTTLLKQQEQSQKTPAELSAAGVPVDKTNLATEGAISRSTSPMLVPTGNSQHEPPSETEIKPNLNRLQKIVKNSLEPAPCSEKLLDSASPQPQRGVGTCQDLLRASASAQKVIGWFQTHAASSRSYFLLSFANVQDMLYCCARLLGHPLQRPPQHLANYSIHQSSISKTASSQPETRTPKDVNIDTTQGSNESVELQSRNNHPCNEAELLQKAEPQQPRRTNEKQRHMQTTQLPPPDKMSPTGANYHQ